MGGEIFKDSLRKLEVKPTQKLQKFISLETRENSQHSDINIYNNDTNPIMKFMFQRNFGNKINKNEDIIKLLSRKIMLEKNILASIINRHRNNVKNIYIDDNDKKNITPKPNINTINKMENSKTINKSITKYENKAKVGPKDDETNNLSKYVITYSKYIRTNKYVKVKIKINIFRSNIFYVLVECMKNKSVKIFDPGINIDNLDDEAITIKIEIMLDNLYNRRINSRRNMMKIITYERKIKIFIDDINYPTLIERCKQLVKDENVKLNVLKLHWSLYLNIYELIIGYNIYFNDLPEPKTVAYANISKIFVMIRKLKARCQGLNDKIDNLALNFIIKFHIPLVERIRKKCWILNRNLLKILLMKIL